MVFPDIGDTVMFQNTSTGDIFSAKVDQLIVNPPDDREPCFIGMSLSNGDRVWGLVSEIRRINGVPV